MSNEDKNGTTKLLLQECLTRSTNLERID